MDAKLTHSNGVYIVHVGGTLDIEETQGFKSAILKKLGNEKVVFNIQKALFVGSTGIGFFLETVKEIAQTGVHGVKMVGGSSEFRRLLQNLELGNLEFHESEDLAVKSFQPKAVSEGLS